MSSHTCASVAGAKWVWDPGTSLSSRCRPPSCWQAEKQQQRQQHRQRSARAGDDRQTQREVTRGLPR
ncbi:MAG: hypothetical protein ACMX3H_06900 [Sodalis sp. (in: enterobacteria)]|uniref:hypothetical protein n=1 Tax=Sodalis sp. (in: enterobacteria) TaxID=1898979 RepID=UPI0039E5277E